MKIKERFLGCNFVEYFLDQIGDLLKGD